MIHFDLEGTPSCVLYRSLRLRGRLRAPSENPFEHVDRFPEFQARELQFQADPAYQALAWPFGYDELAGRAANAGVGGFIVPDLPLEESGELRESLEARGLGVIQLVTPATPTERVERLASASRGFLYAVTIKGVTGGGTGLPADLAGYLDRVSAASPLPVCAGFGIRTAADVDSVGRHAAGAIVGSALVEVLEQGEDPAAFLEALSA